MKRILLDFPDLGASIPRDAQIGDAQLGFNVASRLNTRVLQLFDLTRPFSQYQATWNTATTGTGGQSWTTPGGDYTTTLPSAQIQAYNVNAEGTYTTAWVPAPWLQGWIDSGQYGQAGFMLKLANEATQGEVCIHATPAAPSDEGAYLNVYWNYRPGLDPAMKYFSHALDGHESLNVNLANGNFVDTSSEFADSAPGVRLTIARTYNSVQAVTPGGCDNCAGRCC